MKRFDYLIVGSGLFGSVFARTVSENGATCLIIDKRDHLGGNVYSENQQDINIHLYGPHIFHTSCERIWEFVNRFSKFHPYRHKVLANFEGKLFSMPFNMLTYYQMWGCSTPKEAAAELERQKVKIPHPANLEEWALSHIGTDLYQKLVYGYTKKQWQRDPKDLPSSILRRLPCRMTFDDNYYNDPYQGIPVNGYTNLVENMIDGIEIRLNADFADVKDWRSIANKLVYSGSIDELFGYRHGYLEYRSLDFKNEIVDGDYQGITQMNFTSASVPHTRIIEHQHFGLKLHPKSVITFEYPQTWEPGKSRYYPINDAKNNDLYLKYKQIAQQDDGILIGGRLGSFRYYDMDQAIGQAIHVAEKEMGTPSGRVPLSSDDF